MTEIVKPCQLCPSCQTIKRPQKETAATMSPLPTTPWVFRAAHFFGPIPTGEKGITDLFSEVQVVEVVKTTTHRDRLDSLFFGLHISIIMDHELL